MKIMKMTLSIVLLTAFLACGLGGSDEMEMSEYKLRQDDNISVTSNGGTPAYTYGWSNGEASGAVATSQAYDNISNVNGHIIYDASEKSIAPEKIIKRGTINMEVEDYEAQLAKLKSLVKTSRGYVGNESETRNNYQVSNHIVIRVASSQFDGLMDNIAGLAFELKEKHASLSDVTEEFYDIEARLKAKREVEQRYLDILQKADSVEDILKVERELKNIREEIEAKEGRLKYLENHVSFSTINVTLYENFDYEPPIAQGDSFLAKMGDALEGGWEGLLGLIIGMTYMWPFLIAVAVIVFATIRLIKRRRAVRLATA